MKRIFLLNNRQSYSAGIPQPSPNYMKPKQMRRGGVNMNQLRSFLRKADRRLFDVCEEERAERMNSKKPLSR